MANPNPPLENLKPFKPGQSGNPAGTKPGTKHLKTLIQEIGNDINWDMTRFNNETKQDLNNKYGKNGFKAIIYVMITKAIEGGVQEAKWLAENGYGKSVDITSDGNPINVVIESSYGREPKFRKDNTPTETS
jgi:hypothetical protein